jgi:hypothetical protein
MMRLIIVIKQCIWLLSKVLVLLSAHTGRSYEILIQLVNSSQVIIYVSPFHTPNGSPVKTLEMYVSVAAE